MPFAEVNGIRLHYQLHGAPARAGERARADFKTVPALLTILGGLGDTIRNWSIVAAQLARGMNLLLIDNRGAGQSARPSAPYSIGDMAGDVVALLSRLGIAQTHLLGFSMGGKIAMQIAARHPDLVDKLILVAATPASETGPHPFETKVKGVLENFSNTPEHFSRTFELLFGERYRKKFSSEMFIKFKMNDPHPQEEKDFALQLAAVRAFDITGEAAFITAPTLILHGSEDRMTSVENARWLKENIPHAELKIYEGAGHIPQAEETPRFVRDVTEFLVG